MIRLSLEKDRPVRGKEAEKQGDLLGRQHYLIQARNEDGLDQSTHNGGSEKAFGSSNILKVGLKGFADRWIWNERERNQRWLQDFLPKWKNGFAIK